MKPDQMPQSITVNVEKENLEKDFFNLNKPTIENEDDFFKILIDAKNNLVSLENHAKSHLISEEDFAQSFNEIRSEFITFDEYLLNSGIVLPDNYRNNKSVKELMRVYDSIINKIKNVKSKSDFIEVLPDVEQIPNKPYALGLSNE